MSKPLIIGISGGSGSGKTTFLKRIRQTFDEQAVCIISQDDYYKALEEQERDEAGIENFDLPASIDHTAFVNDIHQLIVGNDVERLEYTFNNQDAVPNMLTFCAAPIIIVEGIFVFYIEEIRALLDLKVFIHAKENLKVIRRIKRDRLERNYPLDDVLYRYENHVLPTFEKYIKPYLDVSDIVINNNDNFEMGFKVVAGFLRNYLRENQ